MQTQCRNSAYQRCRLILLITLGLLAWFEMAARPSAAQNPTVTENQHTGSTSWQMTNPSNDVGPGSGIEGFASAASVNRGGSIDLFVNTGDTAYTIDVYRMGWYNGAGARHIIGPIGPLKPNGAGSNGRQIMPSADPTTGLIECNWNKSYTLQLTSTTDPVGNWPSGVYLALLTTQNTQEQAYIIFVVRDDSRSSDILFPLSFNTYEAYNTWPDTARGGKSLYDIFSSNGKANKVSFNRPFGALGDTSAPVGLGAGDFLDGGDGGPIGGWEYCMVRFLEKNGCDVTYSTDADTHENGNLLLSHNTLLIVGHSEYWSQQMHDNVIAARDHGVKIGFLGGNICYWQVRYEPSTVNGAADRTLVCYKGHPDSTLSVGTLDPYYTSGDPSQANLITVRWRDGLSGSTRTPRPEEQFVGTMYDFGADNVNTGINIINASNWIFTTPNATGLSNGSQLKGLLGYEVDRMQRALGPAGAIDLAHSEYLSGNSEGDDGPSSGSGWSDMTVYTAVSGATVFAAGSINWAFGLDDWGVSQGLRSSTLSTTVQTITKNFLARPHIVPIADTGGPYYAALGNAVMVDGARSFDPTAGGGITSYFWDFGDGTHASGSGGTHTYTTSGRYQITLTVTNTTGNTNTATTVATIGQPLSIWYSDPAAANPTLPYEAATNDGNAIEVGVKFRSDVGGQITGIRFYKSTSNTGTHVGNLWTSSGTLLATATFTNETASGWQQVLFSNPVTIQANTTYVASYHTNTGFYASDSNYFTFEAFDNAPLHALMTGTDGSNGVYVYSSTSSFPTEISKNAANYWVDVLFTPGSGSTAGSAPIVTAVTPDAGSVRVPINTTVTAIFSNNMDASTITGSTFYLQDGSGNTVPASISYDAANDTAALTPSSPLSGATMYTATVLGGSTGVKDTTGLSLSSNYTWAFTTLSLSLWDDAVTPANTAFGDNNAIELGVKFTTNTPGYIGGIQFYKATSNTGTHIGSLWSSSGQLLAQATFSNETASGWQQVVFSKPVFIYPNTTYVASYHTNVGNYCYNSGYFTSAGFDNAPLHALMNGVAGGNGVYQYGSGGFPTNSYNSANYWVDVLFTTVPFPVVDSVTPTTGSANAPTGTTVTATFSKAMNSSTINTGTFILTDSSNNTVPASVSYNSSTNTATLTPNIPLNALATYNARIVSGANGVQDTNGNSLSADYTWSFTTQGQSLWNDAVTPANTAFGDSNSVELGVKFTTDTTGYIHGIQFYKAATNIGTHMGKLWDSNGNLLAQATFSNETASGWQQVLFSTPVKVTAGVTYVASYHTNVGNYSYNSGYFTSAGYDNAPLHALASGVSGGNGVYQYGSGGFPTNSYNSANYWVDVIFSTQ